MNIQQLHWIDDNVERLCNTLSDIQFSSKMHVGVSFESEIGLVVTIGIATVRYEPFADPPRCLVTIKPLTVTTHSPPSLVVTSADCIAAYAVAAVLAHHLDDPRQPSNVTER